MWDLNLKKSKKNPQNQTPRKDQIGCVITRGRGSGEEELEDGGEKTQTSSQKKNKY